MDPSTRSLHRGHRRPEHAHVTDPHLRMTGPRAEVVQILANAVLALITQGRVSSSGLAHRHAEVIP